MEDIQFEFRVVNLNFNGKEVEMFNIFGNCLVNEYTNKAIRKYLRKGYTYEELKEEINHIIHWQEWSRCQYEIMVGSLFEDDVTKFKRMDCYYQAHANIGIITDYCIKTYKEAIKKNKLEKKKDKNQDLVF